MARKNDTRRPLAAFTRRAAAIAWLRGPACPPDLRWKPSAPQSDTQLEHQLLYGKWVRLYLDRSAAPGSFGVATAVGNCASTSSLMVSIESSTDGSSLMTFVVGTEVSVSTGARMFVPVSPLDRPIRWAPFVCASSRLPLGGGESRNFHGAPSQLPCHASGTRGAPRTAWSRLQPQS